MTHSETFTFGIADGEYPPSTFVLDSFFRRGDVLKVGMYQTTATLEFTQHKATRQLECPSSDFQNGDKIIVLKELT